MFWFTNKTNKSGHDHAIRWQGAERLEPRLMLSAVPVMPDANDAPSFELTKRNLVVEATDGNDDIVVAACGRTVIVGVNGTMNIYDTRQLRTIAIDGKAGVDRIRLFGDAYRNERVSMSADGSMYAVGKGWKLNSQSTEMMSFQGAGNDRVSMQGDDDSQTLSANAQLKSVAFEGENFIMGAEGVSRVDIDGGGGKDVAFVYDSMAGEQIHVDLATGTVRLQSRGFRYQMQDFADVQVFAENGGHDRAVVLGSAGNDQFMLNSQTAMAGIAGNQQMVRINGADRYTFKGNGGYDQATLTDTAGDDRFWANGACDRAHLRSDSMFVNMVGIDQVTVNAIYGGYDRARLLDSPADDVFTSDLQNATAQMTSELVTYRANGFDFVVGKSRYGGNDVAVMYDSAGDDLLLTHGQWNCTRWIGNGMEYRGVGFDANTASAIHGGYDSAIMRDSRGNDRLDAELNQAVLSGDGFSHTVIGVDAIEAKCRRFGEDHLYIAATTNYQLSYNRWWTVHQDDTPPPPPPIILD